VKEKSILKEKVTYKLQVWDIKSVGPESGELKNSLTFDVSEQNAVQTSFLSTWRKNVVLDYKLEDFYVPDMKHSSPELATSVNKIKIYHQQQAEYSKKV
jgi:hypothetical protein